MRAAMMPASPASRQSRVCQSNTGLNVHLSMVAKIVNCTWEYMGLTERRQAPGTHSGEAGKTASHEGHSNIESRVHGTMVAWDILLQEVQM